MTEARMWEQGDAPRRRRGGRRGGGGRGRGEQTVVPDATFSSYYGRPILKRPVWQERDIAGYLFTGGLAAGSALIAAGGDVTGRPALRRVGRLGAIGALGVSMYALIDDLGRPERFYAMLRVLKPTSAMSIGSWLLAGFGLPAAVAAAAEVPGLVPPPLRPVGRVLARPAGLAAAAIAPGVATYTAVLLADTSVPTWHEAYPELPFMFGGSALTAASGLALVLAPVAQCGPVRRLAVAGAALELASAQRMESRLDLVGEPLREGRPGRMLKASRVLTVAGAGLAATAGGRWRAAAVAAGAALFAGSVLTRFGVFEAGVESSEDPKYVVRPQRERLEQRAAAEGG